jgi:GNAT superfamily N-acetyltransferase
MDPIVRIMKVEDLPGVVASADAAFADLAIRLHRPPPTGEPDPQREEIGGAILKQLLRLDAGAAFVALDGDTVLGATMSRVRDGLWFLGQLHLVPTAQGYGLGRRLLDAATSYGSSAHGMLLHSSLDPQAMGCYQRAGFQPRTSAGCPRAGARGRHAGGTPESSERRWTSDLLLYFAAVQAGSWASQPGDQGLDLPRTYGSKV